MGEWRRDGETWINSGELSGQEARTPEDEIIEPYFTAYYTNGGRLWASFTYYVEHAVLPFRGVGTSDSEDDGRQRRVGRHHLAGLMGKHAEPIPATVGGNHWFFCLTPLR